MMMNNLPELMKFYKGKKVFVTGDTGFKGTWLCKLLTMAQAEVTGYALPSASREAAASRSYCIPSSSQSSMTPISRHL